MTQFEEKQLTCKDCSKNFVWSIGEQKFFAEKGFEHPPVRCPDCRAKAKKKRDGPPLHDIRCRVCGKTGQIPAEPTDPTDILCQDCLLKSLQAGGTDLES